MISSKINSHNFFLRKRTANKFSSECKIQNSSECKTKSKLLTNCGSVLPLRNFAILWQNIMYPGADSSNFLLMKACPTGKLKFIAPLFPTVSFWNIFAFFSDPCPDKMNESEIIIHFLTNKKT